MLPFGYCERLSPAFWAEPLNAVTNAAFLLAALAGLLLWRRDRSDRVGLGLVALVFAIGIGSFLFHTLPNRWTLLADVVPIQLFAFTCFFVVCRRCLGAGALTAGLCTLGLLGLSVALGPLLGPLLPPTARGSAGYAGFALALFGTGLAVRARRQAPATANLLLSAGLVFALSLTLRSLDGPLCRTLPVGTHFLWHILNGIVLYLLLRAVLLHPRQGGGTGG